MNSSLNKRVGLAILVVSIFLITQTGDAFAREGKRHNSHGFGHRSHQFNYGYNYDRNYSYGYNYHHNRHYYRNHHYHRYLPYGHTVLRLADAIYYYFRGDYYRKTHSGYVVVDELPHQHRKIVYDDTPTYYDL